MRSLLFIIASFTITILAWGLYGPVLHWGQAGMVTEAGAHARFRPFVCVGLAYFAIGVVVPAVLLKLKGEQGDWTFRGVVLSLAGGALGALGAMGIILAFNFGGKPTYVMPLVFGGAPVVNAFLTIYMAKRLKEIGPLFLAGLVMVLIGAVTILLFSPKAKQIDASQPSVAEAVETSEAEASEIEKPAGKPVARFVLCLVSIAGTILCWGAYGPVLHQGQAAMHHSRLRPLICVGLAYFAIAVLLPNLLLTIWTEASSYTAHHGAGTLWSLAAGTAGAIGALGIILAFHFGGKPVYVMPLIFGGAPVVNTFFSAATQGTLGEIQPIFLAGLILVIAGAAIVLVFAPKGAPAKPIEPEPAKPSSNTQ